MRLLLLLRVIRLLLMEWAVLLNGSATRMDTHRRRNATKPRATVPTPRWTCGPTLHTIGTRAVQVQEQTRKLPACKTNGTAVCRPAQWSGGIGVAQQHPDRCAGLQTPVGRWCIGAAQQHSARLHRARCSLAVAPECNPAADYLVYEVVSSRLPRARPLWLQFRCCTVLILRARESNGLLVQTWIGIGVISVYRLRSQRPLGSATSRFGTATAQLPGSNAWCRPNQCPVSPVLASTNFFLPCRHRPHASRG